MILLRDLFKYIKNNSPKHCIFVLGIGYMSRQGYALGIRPPGVVYMTSGWGCPIAVGMGLALGTANKEIVVIDGDGSFLHSPSFLVSLRTLNLPNLHVIIIENQHYDCSGRQEIKAFQYGLMLKNIINGFGFENVVEIENIKDLYQTIRSNKEHRFSIIKTKCTKEILPRIPKAIINKSFQWRADDRD